MALGYGSYDDKNNDTTTTARILAAQARLAHAAEELDQARRTLLFGGDALAGSAVLEVGGGGGEGKEDKSGQGGGGGHGGHGINGDDHHGADHSSSMLLPLPPAMLPRPSVLRALRQYSGAAYEAATTAGAGAGADSSSSSSSSLSSSSSSSSNPSSISAAAILFAPLEPEDECFLRLRDSAAVSAAVELGDEVSNDGGGIGASSPSLSSASSPDGLVGAAGELLCLPRGHPFYESTRSGVSELVHRMVDEALALAAAPPEAVRRLALAQGAG